MTQSITCIFLYIYVYTDEHYVCKQAHMHALTHTKNLCLPSLTQLYSPSNNLCPLLVPLPLLPSFHFSFLPFFEMVSAEVLKSGRKI